MELLADCQKLYSKLKDLSNGLNKVEKMLKDRSLHPEEYRDLYEREFYLTMEISDCYADLKSRLKELKRQEEMMFYATRMETNADALVRSEIIDVNQ
jgi:protein subunit release factor A